MSSSLLHIEGMMLQGLSLNFIFAVVYLWFSLFHWTSQRLDPNVAVGLWLDPLPNCVFEILAGLIAVATVTPESDQKSCNFTWSSDCKTRIGAIVAMEKPPRWRSYIFCRHLMLLVARCWLAVIVCCLTRNIETKKRETWLRSSERSSET